MADLPAAVHDLDRDLRGIFSGRLRSLVVYGLRLHTDEAHGADGHSQAQGHGEGHGLGHETPLTHTLAVIDRLTAADLRACAGRVAAWHDAGLATPLLVAEHEFESSLDAFPFEFGDILSNHAIVSGGNPFEGLTVEPADLRRACEVQARSHLLHLREGYLETRGRSDALAELIVRSAPAFAALITSLARLEGTPAADLTSTGRFVERTLGLAGTSVTDIAGLVGVHEISSADAERLFPPYLTAVEQLVAFVDAWKTA